ncbi:hypothetical protein N9164_10835 [Draconibacterium sp.]|nr:hypothetical protein [Draconibacterium sp.]
MNKNSNKVQFEQTLGQLEKLKGGYFYVEVEKETVLQFEMKRSTRLICAIDKR